jgi:dephospho-CoA kinase
LRKKAARSTEVSGRVGVCALAAHVLGAKLRVVGVTGSVGVGKSTLREKLQRSFPEMTAIDVDASTRLLLSPGNLVYRSLVRSFGQRAVLHNDSHQLDRAKLSKLISQQQSARLRWNRILTRYLFLDTAARIIRHGFLRPVLIDISWDYLKLLPSLQWMMDPLLVVETDADTVYNRVAERTKEDAARVRALYEPKLKSLVTLQSIFELDRPVAGLRIAVDNGSAPAAPMPSPLLLQQLRTL